MTQALPGVQSRPYAAFAGGPARRLGFRGRLNGVEMRRKHDALAGIGLMQSPEEWAARGGHLAATLAALIRDHAETRTGRGLDIGCQNGDLIDDVAQLTGIAWAGIDPILAVPRATPNGAPIGPGRANDIPFPDGTFDAALFANVFEHIPPAERQPSLNEMFRVLAPGGVVAGQIPNPYFPIENHSRLPFFGFLPSTLQRRYWQLSRVPWEHDFCVVTMRHLRRHATRAGFVVERAAAFNYPPDAYPRQVRWLAVGLRPVMWVYPWSWQFVLRKPAVSPSPAPSRRRAGRR